MDWVIAWTGATARCQVEVSVSLALLNVWSLAGRIFWIVAEGRLTKHKRQLVCPGSLPKIFIYRCWNVERKAKRIIKQIKVRGIPNTLKDRPPYDSFSFHPHNKSHVHDLSIN